MLNLEQKQQYETKGYLLPFHGVSACESQKLLTNLNNVSESDVTAVKNPWYYKSYLLFTWLDKLVRNRNLLKPVEALLGKDILCLSCDVWRKKARETRHISWHQDASYWKFSPPKILTVWLSLTEASSRNGCMRFLPGSQKLGSLHHVKTFAPDNILSHGQSLQIKVDEARTVCAELRPGQFSIHHCLLAHASGPNPTSHDRVGLCIRYAPGHLRQENGPPVSAMTVRGIATGNLVSEKPPTKSLNALAIDQHNRLLTPHAPTRYTHF